MTTIRFGYLVALAAIAALACADSRAAESPGSDDPLAAIVELLTDKDKDVRALGLEQVRDAAKGEAATRRFAALLPQLSPEAQVGLLGALAERGDSAARGEVIKRIESHAAEVRSAAIRALGSLGAESDVPRLIDLLSKPATEKDAAAAVQQLRGEKVNAALVAESKRRLPVVRVAVLKLLIARRAVETVPALLEAAGEADPTVRLRAIEALGKLAGPEQVPALAQLVLQAAKTSDAPAREQAELAVMSACQKIKDANKRAAPLLAEIEKADAADQTALLPTLGRIGGRPVLPIVDAAMADSDPARRAAGLKALCNWPDGSVAPRLLDLAKTAAEPKDRDVALAALIRVGPLPDKRPDAERLAMLRAALELSTRGEQKTTILRRARAIYTLETIRLVAPYMEQLEFSQIAAETVVDLARRKNVRMQGKDECDKALDRAIEVSKDPAVIDRAKRFKAGRT